MPSKEAIALKAVILYFWATRCGTCLASFPHLKTVWGDQVRSLAFEKEGKILTVIVGNDGPTDHRLEDALRAAGIE
ncbi:hypothetical protein [Armatimonas sp.]|uniref:hypothetical protein n=1 Tax=Armatimonas sp. TaxID=1872638 RepID=UPI003750A395